MSDTFYSKPADIQLRELVEELYKRLGDSRRLLEMYDAETNLGYVERGYAQGIREEIGYLVRILDKYERS